MKTRETVFKYTATEFQCDHCKEWSEPNHFDQITGASPYVRCPKCKHESYDRETLIHFPMFEELGYLPSK